MAKAVVLLSCDEDCAQAAKIAKAILAGYAAQDAVEVYLYNYRTRTLHRLTRPMNGAADVTTANMGVLQPSGNPDVRVWSDMARFLGCDASAVPRTAITQQQLATLGQLAKCKQAMTTLDVNKFDKKYNGEWPTHAGLLLDSIRAKLSGYELCFMIAPNARNAPLRLQTFGHKLGWDAPNNRVQYHKNSGATFDISHLVETQYDAVCSLVEIALCRALITSSRSRFLGNCYGAQIMWLSLGGGLTSFKRNQGAAHGNTLVVTEANDRPVLNVSWNDGISVGDRDHGEPLLGSSTRNNQANATYNTDYHHSCMMILSQDLSKAHDGVENSFVRHQLADLITSDDVDDQLNQEFLTKLRGYAAEQRWDLDLPNAKDSWKQKQKQKRTWGWIGEYHYDNGRISGFQGHPLLHLDIQHVRQRGTKDYMRQQMFG